MRPARERSAGKPTRREAPAPRDESPPEDPFVRELRGCVERVTEAGRLDLLEELLVGLREILHHPAELQPSREDPA